MKSNRLILVSDIHYTMREPPCDKEGFLYYYGEKSEYRMQKLWSLIQEEHHRSPLDALVFLGDTVHDTEENLRDFFRKWADDLPCPAYYLPGNHEAFSEEIWREVTGCGRQSVAVLPYCKILMCDCFSDLKHPHRIQPMNMEFLKEQAEKYPGEKMLLCTHYFHWEEPLEQWLLQNPQVVAVFHGHTHLSVPNLGSIGGKKVISTGNFSYGLNMEEGIEWYRKWGWSVTEVCECDGLWKCRKIYPDMLYAFSKLESSNRFCQTMHHDYKVSKEYGDWVVL